MQYHALSLARKGAEVEIIGYNESAPRLELLNNEKIKITGLPVPPRWMKTDTPGGFIIYAPFKAAFQLISLLYILLHKLPASTSHILLQTPPSFPMILVARIVGWLRGMKVIIDWHNFGYTILRLKLRNHPIVWAMRGYEYLMSKGTLGLHTQFAVSSAMSRQISGSTPVLTLHDRPPSHFQPLNSDERYQFLSQNPETKDHVDSIRAGVTKLVVSSTSWTADEDFGLLLQALIDYDRRATASDFLSPGSISRLLVLITGRGPLRDGWLARAEKEEFQFVTIKSVWLEAADYPKLIACADLGVCLHTSSSGVDLPMKVVDLLGVGVPVVAKRFEAIGELVKQGENGVLFEDGEELGRVLEGLLGGLGGNKVLEKLRKGAGEEGGRRWDGEWDKIAAPVFGL